MNTPLEKIYDRFIKKIKNDEDFFDYKDLSEDEVKSIVGDHLIELFTQAIEEIYDNGNPDVDLYDINKEKEEFNFELTHLEISLIVNLMYQKYIEEDRVKLKALQFFFRSDELNVFSPANERKTFEDMLDKIISENKRRMSSYFARDRITGKIKI
ncbi:hypothetical protein [Clostridium botulinum]|uniref:hypothetical protein n=2 Tax=Clostridium botulinum TaxID=1491 RepID=UPI0007734D88|nr:hypothetical protein [Clostridium botulinum]